MLNRTGFVHMNGRVCDPRIGRFVSPDPIVQAPTGQGELENLITGNVLFDGTHVATYWHARWYTLGKEVSGWFE